MLVLCAYLKSIAHHACRAFLKQKGINLKNGYNKKSTN